MIKKLKNTKVKPIESINGVLKRRIKEKIYSIIEQVDSMHLNSRPSKAATSSFLQVIVEQCCICITPHLVYM